MKWQIVYSGILSAGMSGLVALIVTLINTGPYDGVILRWLTAWGLAFPVAWSAALVWGPAARRLAALFVQPPDT